MLGFLLALLIPCNASPSAVVIGIQTFAKIRADDYYYGDKPLLAWRLARDGGYCFLSRPRRFGKSLFVVRVS